MKFGIDINKNEFKNIIFEICDILNITKVKISYDVSKFRSETMMAQVDVEKRIIYLKRFNIITPDIFFVIFHELRHLWQYDHNKELFILSYKEVNEFDNVNDYNLQLAEIDANAFAGLMIMDLFGLKPLYKGLSEKVKNKIYERIEVIKKEF